MQKISVSLILFLMVSLAYGQDRKVHLYQLMESGFNNKEIKGTISEVYSTKRFGKTFWWVRIGTDTLIHIWPKRLDTATMKPGVSKTFTSIKRFESNWWRKEKSEDQVVNTSRQVD